MVSSTTMTGKSKSMTVCTQIEERLRHKIAVGEWSEGIMLPGRRDLAREYGVSTLTIDRAVTRLIAEGLLRADDRRGTFVTRLVAPVVDSSGSFSGNGVEAYTGTVITAKTSAATVGIVAPLYIFNDDHHELHNFWMRLLFQLLEQDLSEDGKTTHFFNQVKAPNQPLTPLSETVAEAKAAGVDAIAVVTFNLRPEDAGAALASLQGGDIPVVCVTTGPMNRPIPHLFYDNVSAGYDVATHLLQRGYRDIRFYSPFRAEWVEQRLEGVQAAIRHTGGGATLSVFPESAPAWTLDQDPEMSGYESADIVLKEGIAGAGVVCANDGVAIGLLRAAEAQGMTAGADFGLVGFDDRSDARTNGLTTMRPPMEAIGKEMARLLSRAIQGEKTDLQLRLRSHLIPRGSTLPSRMKKSQKKKIQ